MKAVIYINRIIENAVRLFYATCTNDLIVNSKQSGTLEIFFLAMCIESNRMFISNTTLAKSFEKHIIENSRTTWQSIKLMYLFIFIQDNEKKIYGALEEPYYEAEKSQPFYHLLLRPF